MLKIDWILMIDGENLSIYPCEGKSFLDIGKSALIYHSSSIVSCTRMGISGLKLVVGTKALEFEAGTSSEADDICGLVTHINKLTKVFGNLGV